MFRLLLVVVHIVKIKGVMVDKAENHTPVCTNRNRPKTFLPAFEGMQLKTGHIHVGHGLGRVEPCENIAQLDSVFSHDATRVVFFMETFQSLVAYRSYHIKP